ncbi:hypothetical protein AAVH_21353 [Aphelenchoides avenae]|nr:hypothetical protein AAVH_21353 [Aphelenchus avenae]
MSSTQYREEFRQTSNVDNCTNCRSGTCQEVYHKQIRDEGHQNKGFFEKVKDTVAGAVDGITGSSHDPVKQTRKEISHAEDRAEKLAKEGRKELNSVEKEARKAEKAQHEAAKKAAEANRQTEHALNKQIAGQEKLATAGHKMMEAGAKLQQEASYGSATQVPYNVHGQEQVRQQTTCAGGATVIPQQQEYVYRETTTGGRPVC